MNIGFDIDNVLVDTPLFLPNFLKHLLYKKSNSINLPHQPTLLEKYLRIFAHTSLIRPPIKHNLLYLCDLAKEKKYNIFFISSRYGFLDKKTASWFKKHNLGQYAQDIYLNKQKLSPKNFKNNMIQQLKIDVFVDDDINILMFIAQNNPQVKLYWINDNSSKIFIPSSISRISKLSELPLP